MSITEQFFEKIIQNTKLNKTNWLTLFTYTDIHDIEDLTGYKRILYFDAHHSFDFLNSYVYETTDFFLLILEEIYLDDKSNPSEKKHNVYLSKNKSSTPDIIQISDDLLNELIKAISNQLKDHYQQDTETENIMRSYLDKK